MKPALRSRAKNNRRSLKQKHAGYYPCRRPYHTDPKINHGIDRLITGLGAALISEDSVSGNIDRKDLNKDLEVLNQWTYHSRLYAAAKFAAQNPAMNLVQLVSFGCGCDAITADECRRILEESGKIYTQIKIDDIETLVRHA